MTPNVAVPAVFAALIVVFSLYRRFRSLFGRQPVQPLRMKLRIALLALAGAFVLLRGLTQTDVMLAAAAGLAGGIALAFAGLKWTQFETTPQGSFYTPHSAIGVALSALLLGRLAYRFAVLYPSLQEAQQAGAANPFDGLQHSPLTSATLALFIGYYVTYYIGVLRRSDVPAAKDEQAAPPA
ncbi:MAG TPA: DUF1453 domain-containing protein [Dokdonella sp.]